MTAQAERTNPQMMVDLNVNCARIADRNPEFVKAVHDLVLAELKSGGSGHTEGDPIEHVAKHAYEILPKIMRDPKIAAMIPGLVAEYGRMPNTPDTRLREHAGDHSVGPWPAIVVLVGIGLVGIAIYCTSDVTADPGTSAPVPHVPLFC